MPVAWLKAMCCVPMCLFYALGLTVGRLEGGFGRVVGSVYDDGEQNGSSLHVHEHNPRSNKPPYPKATSIPAADLEQRIS